MKQIIACILVVFFCGAIVAFCGIMMNFINMRGYNTAMMRMPDGEVLEVKVKKFYSVNIDQIKVISEDGKTYLIHSANIILIGD